MLCVASRVSAALDVGIGKPSEERDRQLIYTPVILEQCFARRKEASSHGEQSGLSQSLASSMGFTTISFKP